MSEVKTSEALLDSPSTMLTPWGKVYRGAVNLGDRNCAWTKIVGLVDEGSRVLEIGCAEGYLSDCLTNRKNCRVTGVEINPEAARVARKYCESVVVGDVEKGALNSVRGPFDVVILADVLEHLYHPGRVLQSIHPLLSADGYVVVSLPNVAHWEVRRNLVLGRFDYRRTGLLDDTHIRFFTYQTALELIKDAGFEVETFDLVHKGPRDWKYVDFYRRWEKQMQWLVKKYLRGIFGYQFIFKLRPGMMQHG